MLHQISFTNNVVMVNADLFCNLLCLASLGITILHVQIESSSHYAIQFTTLIFQIKSMNLEQKVQPTYTQPQTQEATSILNDILIS